MDAVLMITTSVDEWNKYIISSFGNIACICAGELHIQLCLCHGNKTYSYRYIFVSFMVTLTLHV